MKKVISKLKPHLHSHHENDQPPQPPPHDERPAQDEVRTSLYENATPRATPQVGESPLAANAAHASASPSIQDHRPTRSPPPPPAPTALAEQHRRKGFANENENEKENENQVAPQTESSSNPFADDARNRPAPAAERALPPTPAAILPLDLNSPEYGYLSKMYGPTSSSHTTTSRHPSASAHPPAPASRLAAETVNGTDDPQSDATIPRKKIGSGSALESDNARRSGPKGLAMRSPDYTSAEVEDTTAPLDRGVLGSATAGVDAAAMATTPSSIPGERIRSRTVDTEIIVKEQPAVVQEVIMPTVHEIREEKVYREIHYHDIYHRIQPIIDVEVLPPRHFVPDGRGGLREVSADDLPGQTEHWGIVETVTQVPPLAPNEPRPPPPALPTEPQIISQTSAVMPEGYVRTETVWKHPPTLDTGGRDSARSWPMLVDPLPFEAKHGILSRTAPIVGQLRDPQGKATEQWRTTSTGQLLYPSIVSPRSSGEGRKATQPGLAAGAPSASAPPASAPSASATRQAATAVDPASHAASGSRSERREFPRVKHGMPGAFPSLSSGSTATMGTFSEQSQPPRR
ncbi:MAG: hypothetical protein M1826_000332 [Phylliscum demangeonii]|nr:MAG: hypothetical protein M1826_000332 [Phylliscum demangeonii]